HARQSSGSVIEEDCDLFCDLHKPLPSQVEFRVPPLSLLTTEDTIVDSTAPIRNSQSRHCTHLPATLTIQPSAIFWSPQPVNRVRRPRNIHLGTSQQPD